MRVSEGVLGLGFFAVEGLRRRKIKKGRWLPSPERTSWNAAAAALTIKIPSCSSEERKKRTESSDNIIRVLPRRFGAFSRFESKTASFKK